MQVQEYGLGNQVMNINGTIAVKLSAFAYYSAARHMRRTAAALTGNSNIANRAELNTAADALQAAGDAVCGVAKSALYEVA